MLQWEDILKPCGVVRHQIGGLTIPISEAGGGHSQDGMRDEFDGGAD